MASVATSTALIPVRAAPLIRVRPAETEPRGITIGEACEQFINSKRHSLASRDICRRTFERYVQVCNRIAGVLGEASPIAEVKQVDFLRLRAAIAAHRHTPSSLAPDIQCVRTFFKFACDPEGPYGKPISFDAVLRRPSAKLFRRARRERGSMMFEAEEIRRLLDVARPAMRAMILLGVNCGFGNSDCGRLPFSALDLDGGWVNSPRPKTEVERRCPLWPETVEAIRRAIKTRPVPKVEGIQELIFVSKLGRRWCDGEGFSPLNRCFSRLMRRAELSVKKFRSFYGLRQTFETIGGDTGFQAAVNYIMGHAPNSGDMAALYRQRFEDHRLISVTDHVRNWLCPDKSQKQLDYSAELKRKAIEICDQWELLDELSGKHVEDAINMLGVNQTELAKGAGYCLDWVNTLVRGREQIGKDAERRFRAFMLQLSEGRIPSPLSKGEIQTQFDSPLDFPLSDEALAALNRQLRIVVNCLKSSGVVQLTLAQWWGYGYKHLREMLCGRRHISQRGADRLRSIFGLQSSAQPLVRTVHEKIPLTPEIESILNVEKFHARQLRSLLRLLRSEFGITTKFVSTLLGKPSSNLANFLMRDAQITSTLQNDLRSLFAKPVIGGAE